MSKAQKCCHWSYDNNGDIKECQNKAEYGCEECGWSTCGIHGKERQLCDECMKNPPCLIPINEL